MDLDLSVLSGVLRTDGGYFLSKKAGINSKMFESSCVKGWKFIEDHVLEFGTVPSLDFFSAKTGVPAVDVEEPLEVLFKDLKRRSLWNELKGTHHDMGASLTDNDPDTALETMKASLKGIYKDGLTAGRAGNLLELGTNVVENYEQIKSGARGIPTPWQALNDMTTGWWDGDFAVFVARMSVGKTFCMLHMAREAWRAGKKVLFVGTEMSRLKLAIRFYCIHLKLPYGQFRNGLLGSNHEEALKKSVKSLSKEKGLYVVGDDFNADMGEIEAALDEIKPDILFVDGFYLVKNEGRNRHERVSNTADDLKRLARMRGLPVIASTQFNREVSTNNKSSVSAENVGISDVIGWNADVMIGMFQTDDMREDAIMGLRPLKLREGSGQEFFVNWDFEQMDFSQEDIDSNGDFSNGDYEGEADWDDGGDEGENDDSLF